jgi:hypothetical protein
MTEAMDPISVRARFERFPATVKGAFIFRGEDPDPHQVVLDRARVVAVGPGASAEVPIAPVTLDVIPHRDLFVPFELSVSELDPGWYTLLCDVQIDGAPDSYDGGRRFCPVAQGNGSSGTVKVERDVVLADVDGPCRTVRLCRDSVKVLLRATRPGPVRCAPLRGRPPARDPRVRDRRGDRPRPGARLPGAEDRRDGAGRDQG